MAGVQKNLRLPPETMKEIEQMAKETGYLIQVVKRFEEETSRFGLLLVE